MPSPGFKHCSSNGGAIPNNDPHMRCCLCLGDAHTKEWCSACESPQGNTWLHLLEEEEETVTYCKCGSSRCDADVFHDPPYIRSALESSLWVFGGKERRGVGGALPHSPSPGYMSTRRERRLLWILLGKILQLGVYTPKWNTCLYHVSKNHNSHFF